MSSPATAPRAPVTPLHVTPRSPGTDLADADPATAGYLAAPGVSTDTEAMSGTPARRARRCAEMLTPRSRAEFHAVAASAPSAPAGDRHG